MTNFLSFILFLPFHHHMISIEYDPILRWCLEHIVYTYSSWVALWKWHKCFLCISKKKCECVLKMSHLVSFRLITKEKKKLSHFMYHTVAAEKNNNDIFPLLLSERERFCGKRHFDYVLLHIFYYYLPAALLYIEKYKFAHQQQK